jgi:tRNA-dihydrouridine synthase B
VIGKNGGSAVLKDLKLLEKIVKKVVEASDIPVTVKMRSGWDAKSLVYLQSGKISQDCGAAAVTLHPRTRTQGFSGEADWTQIAELKNELDIPVIGNGDIRNVTDARRMFDQTGCDGIMLGRASMGNPWIFNRIKEYLKTGEIPPEPSIRERVELALEHFEMTLAHYGTPRGIYKMRSRFIWYLKGFPGASAVRANINRLEDVNEIKELLLNYVEGISKNMSPSDTPYVSKLYI